MISRVITFLFDNKNILSKSDRKTNQIEWKIYNRQQINLIIKRFKTSRIFVVSIIQRSNKFFHIKTIDQTSNKFENFFYVEWVIYVRIMKNQFDQNDCDNYTSNSNRFKILYIEIFLKKKTIAQLL